MPNYEVADTVWVPMQFLSSPENVCDYFFPAGPFRRAWPSFQYGPYTIWGLTYRIVASFMTPFGIELPTERLVVSLEGGFRSVRFGAALRVLGQLGFEDALEVAVVVVGKRVWHSIGGVGGHGPVVGRHGEPLFRRVTF